VPVPETLAAALEQLVRVEQREKRLPSLAAAVVRDGELVWEAAVGAADAEQGRDATPDTQYRVGSITKTFTAAAIMQLRDAGKLDLEDTLDRHIDGAAHRPTLRRLLSHTSSLQRETQDEAWLSLRFASTQELVETLGEADQVLPPGARLYRQVTEGVDSELAARSFADNRFLERLDVCFAGLFFSALDAYERVPASAPSAWVLLVSVGLAGRRRSDRASLPSHRRRRRDVGRRAGARCRLDERSGIVGATRRAPACVGLPRRARSNGGAREPRPAGSGRLAPAEAGAPPGDLPTHVVNG
jgi:hypothetical protein